MKSAKSKRRRTQQIRHLRHSSSPCSRAHGGTPHCRENDAIFANLLRQGLRETQGSVGSTTFSASLHQQKEINELFCVPPSNRGIKRINYFCGGFPSIKTLRLQLTPRRGLIDYAFRQLGGFIFLLFQVCKLKI